MMSYCTTFITITSSQQQIPHQHHINDVVLHNIQSYDELTTTISSTTSHQEWCYIIHHLQRPNKLTTEDVTTSTTTHQLWCCNTQHSELHLVHYNMMQQLQQHQIRNAVKQTYLIGNYIQRHVTTAHHQQQFSTHRGTITLHQPAHQQPKA
jgi:hypothetical protein